MLKRIISLITAPTKSGHFPSQRKKMKSSKVVVGKNKHNVSNKLISRGAHNVISKLQHADFSAYLVGGGVRDLLLGGKPKDFDIATDATPEQIRGVFKNAHIIGKRFRIVHVRFGREIIEVTTFRAGHETAKKQNQSKQSDKGILLRDNVYGDLESDALRRDFSINALYYNPTTHEITDFTGGLEDLKDRKLRIIGDPKTRYKEDPVRMLRAVRFAAKLGFTLEESAESNIHEHTDYLAEIPSARLFEEVLKLFMGGSALATLHKLKDFQLLTHLFPGLSQSLELGESVENELVFCAATNTDKRVRQGKSVTPAFIYASFLWPPLKKRMADLIEHEKLTFNDAFHKSSQEIISQQLNVTAIPKRFLIPMREIWSMQYRLERNWGPRTVELLEHPRFRAAYDFLLLREEAGEKTNSLGTWWTQFQNADSDQREIMFNEPSNKPKPKHKRRRRSPQNKKPPPENDT